MNTDNLRRSWSRAGNHWLTRYALALAAVGAALILRLALSAWVGPDLPTYITFYPFVMLAALVAGIGPGILASVVTVLAVDFWVFSHQPESGTHTLAEIVGHS